MPIYEFECQKCKGKKEFLTSNNHDSIPLKCGCGGIYKKMISHSSFILKGSGWYATDYAKKDKKESKVKKDPKDLTNVAQESKSLINKENKKEISCGTKN